MKREEIKRGLSPHSVVQSEMLDEAGSEIHLRAVSTISLLILQESWPFLGTLYIT